MGNREDIIELIDQTDDEHITHFQNGASQEYLGGWIAACEEMKKKLQGFKFKPRIKLTMKGMFDDEGRLR